MRKRLTIKLDEGVYEGLRSLVGRGRISRFIVDLVRQHVMGKKLEADYLEMARDEAREAEAMEWSEATVSDASE